MRPYEVMIILDPTLEEPVLQEQVDRYAELVHTRGATVGRVERWGRRRLAYELQHHRDGYYVVMETTAEPATMADLDRSLHLADAVLRHKVIRIPDRIAGRQRPSVPPPVDGPSGPTERATEGPSGPTERATEGRAAAAWARGGRRRAAG